MPYNNYTGSSSMGGMIPVEYAREIIQKAPEQSNVLRLGRQLRDMPTKTRTMPVLSALPTAYFVNGETGLKQTSDISWDGVTLTAEEIAVIAPVPEAALADAQYPIWDEMMPYLIEAVGVTLDAAVLHGTNKPSSWPTSIVSAATTKGNTVTLGTGVDLYEDLLDEDGVISKLESDGFMADGHLAHITMRSKLRGVRDANGNPIFSRSMQDAARYELDASPMYFARNNALNSSSALLVSGAWEYLVYAWRQDMEWKVADQGVIQDAAGNIVLNLFQQDMVALRLTLRLGVQLPNPVTRLNTTSGTRYPFAVLLPSS